MSQRKTGSDPDIEGLGEDTPTAQALFDLRKQVFAQKIGPGAVTEVAEAVGMDRGNLSTVIAPSMIEKIARGHARFEHGGDASVAVEAVEFVADGGQPESEIAVNTEPSPEDDVGPGAAFGVLLVVFAVGFVALVLLALFGLAALIVRGGPL